jgi:demethylspheroidene O-methyltransferase
MRAEPRPRRLPPFQDRRPLAAATLCGAAAAGAPAEAWRTVGERIGEAYQVADDLRDVVCDPAAIGKPVGRDAALGRPSAARDLGLEGAVLRLKGLVAEAVESIPSCPGAAALRTVIKTTSRLFLPKDWSGWRPDFPKAASLAVPIALRQAGRSWRERWLAFRDRTLSSPAFQRGAAAFPLTRLVARRRARALFDLCAGFVYAQILQTCVQLGLFQILAGGPQTLATLSHRLSLSPDATRRLLLAAVSLRLVEERGTDRFGLGTLGAALAGNPGLAAMIAHHGMLYDDLRDPVALLRGAWDGGELARYWPYAGALSPAALGRGATEPYTRLMAGSQALVAEEVLSAYRFDRHRRVLDVGGGDGAFLAAALARAPDLRGTLFDLPSVADQARSRFTTLGLARRAEAVGGDFLAVPLPGGADLITLVRVIHDHDDAAVLALLRAIRRVIADDATLLIAEPLAGTPGAEPVGAYFAFYLLAMGSGRPRTAAEMRGLLAAAGFDASSFAAPGCPCSRASSRPSRPKEV